VTDNSVVAPDTVFFPEPEVISQHAIAFARLMFAHAAFEREVRSLQDAITSEPAFGERRSSQWPARTRPKLMAELIKKHLGTNLQEALPIANLLTAAINFCDQRNLLAHGEWWCFNTQKSTISVRGGTRWIDDQRPPEHCEYTASEIDALVEKFRTTELELFKLRRCIENRQ